MATVYNKSISTDFGGNIIPNQVMDEINADGGIIPECLSINTDDDLVSILFASAISTGEQTTLDTIIGNHVPSTRRDFVQNISINITDFTSTVYTTVGTFIYLGSKYMVITDMDCISSMDVGGVSYDVRLFCPEDNTTILHASLSNTDIGINSISVTDTLPVNESILEIQIKVVGTTSIDVPSLNICYNKLWV